MAPLKAQDRSFQQRSEFWIDRHPQTHNLTECKSVRGTPLVPLYPLGVLSRALLPQSNNVLHFTTLLLQSWFHGGKNSGARNSMPLDPKDFLRQYCILNPRQRARHRIYPYDTINNDLDTLLLKHELSVTTTLHSMVIQRLNSCRGYRFHNSAERIT